MSAPIFPRGWAELKDPELWVGVIVLGGACVTVIAGVLALEAALR